MHTTLLLLLVISLFLSPAKSKRPRVRSSRSLTEQPTN